MPIVFHLQQCKPPLTRQFAQAHLDFGCLGMFPGIVDGFLCQVKDNGLPGGVHLLHHRSIRVQLDRLLIDILHFFRHGLQGWN